MAVDVRSVGEESGVMFIGMNNYADYVPEVCDGHLCPRDCDKCPWQEKAWAWKETHDREIVQTEQAVLYC